ncbi:MAG TPA: dehydrogenase E1 component subunit alpha/beta [Acidimicrobiales bacterium]|nr:dehydrogenase E1 component subunit alpha/beta [Acidimicrobiales bacterium]
MARVSRGGRRESGRPADSGSGSVDDATASIPTARNGSGQRHGMKANEPREADRYLDDAESFRGVARKELIEDFRLACVSRAIDDREITLQKQSRVFFQISGAGHEILLLALARSLRPGYDWFFPYYRDQALVLGLGVTPKEILLQAVGSAEDPNSGGRQMPSHWGHQRYNIVSQTSPTGSQCLPAVGCAEAARYIAPRQGLTGCTAFGDEVTYVSLGEGATSEGEFWESLNTACRLHLPVLYLVADNGYAISVRASDQAPAPISELVRGFRGLAVTKFDGTDYFAARQKGAHAIARVRAGEGPGLIHATVTRPYSHSSQDTQAKYRSPEELAEEASHDPILRLEHQLVRGGVLTPEEAQQIREEAHRLVAEAAREALAAARPDPRTVTDHVLALPRIDDPGEPTAAAEAPQADPIKEAVNRGEAVGMGDAIRLTLHELMAADERIRVFGEDVADAPEDVVDLVEGKGGVFGTTHGLQRAFGVARCYNTPLAEANIVGRGIGQALRGLRPCAEIQFFDYIWPAMHQIRAEAATARWRSQGRFTVPLVIRVAIGGYVKGGALWHSQCGESIFAHIPGLIVVFPSRAADAAGLLRAAFRCDDPVMFLEHKHLLRQKYAMDPFPPPGYVLPLGKAAMRRPGRDLSIVSWGATVQKSLDAAARLATDGIEVEVVDLRTLVPWDREAVAATVAKTARLLVVHEDVLTAGFGGEIAAFAADECFESLDAPVRRVAATDTFVAYEPTLEAAILPQVEDIEQAARQLAAF